MNSVISVPEYGTVQCGRFIYYPNLDQLDENEDLSVEFWKDVLCPEEDSDRSVTNEFEFLAVVFHDIQQLDGELYKIVNDQKIPVNTTDINQCWGYSARLDPDSLVDFGDSQISIRELLQ